MVRQHSRHHNRCVDFGLGWERGEKMTAKQKPPTEKAKQAGSCYVCGGRFFVGDKIRIVQDGSYTPPIIKACHSDCY